MNKQLLFIPLILAATALGAVQILRLKPPEPKGEAHEYEHEEHHHDDHEAAQVKLTPEALKNANLKIEEAAAAKIAALLPVYGKIAVNDDTIAHVQPRFPGVVKEVRKRLGDAVAKGELIAIIESNESLNGYQIKSEIAGTVIQKDITLGEFVKHEDTIYTIADLANVWVDLTVFRQDFQKLKLGQSVAIHPGADDETITGTISYISPFGTEGTQSMLARCVVANPHGDLRPGLFVTAEIATGETAAPVAVQLAAIQKLKDKTVVFVEEGDAFEARAVELGARDRTHAEVRRGLAAGDRYVSANSFILKAELGKEEAEHEH